MRLTLAYSATLFVILCGAVGCAAALADGVAAGVARGAALGAGAEAFAARAIAAEGLAGEAIAVRTIAGLSGDAAMMGITVTEDFAAGAAFRAAAMDLESTTGLRLFRDPQGLLSVSGARIGVTGDGAVVLGPTSRGAAKMIGRFRDGEIWAINESGAATQRLGKVRAVSAGIRPVELYESPWRTSALRARMSSGPIGTVLRVRNGWFEIGLDDYAGASGTKGWVDGATVGLVVGAVGSTRVLTNGVKRPSCEYDPRTLATDWPWRRFAFLRSSVRVLRLMDDGEVRVTLDLVNEDNETRSLTVALNADNAQLVDGFGERYAMQTASDITSAASAAIVRTLQPGATRTVVIRFRQRTDRNCDGPYTLHIALRVGLMDEIGAFREQVVPQSFTRLMPTLPESSR